MTLTPEQFNKLVTKEEYNKLSEKVDSIETKIDAVLTVLNVISNKLDKIEQENTSNIAAHNRMTENILNHEKRIGSIELALGN